MAGSSSGPGWWTRCHTRLVVSPCRWKEERWEDEKEEEMFAHFREEGKRSVTVDSWYFGSERMFQMCLDRHPQCESSTRVFQRVTLKSIYHTS